MFVFLPYIFFPIDFDVFKGSRKKKCFLGQTKAFSPPPPRGFPNASLLLNELLKKQHMTITIHVLHFFVSHFEQGGRESMTSFCLQYHLQVSESQKARGHDFDDTLYIHKTSPVSGPGSEDY